MPRVPVKTVNSARRVLNHLARLMKSVQAEIQERAFQREDGEGHELENWTAAERDVIYSPPCILAESHDEIHVQVAVPLVNPKTLQVDIMPESITIEGRMLTTKGRRGERIHLREFGGEQVLRQFDLPARIDPKCAKATLENGVLYITAKKSCHDRDDPGARDHRRSQEREAHGGLISSSIGPSDEVMSSISGCA